VRSELCWKSGYEHLDEGSQQDHARLRQAWERAWGAGDGTSTVLPYDEGIHRMGSPGKETAISVHLYGPQMAEIDGQELDPSRDHVCDRLDSSEQEYSQSR
jgi:hypothetical protein